MKKTAILILSLMLLGGCSENNSENKDVSEKDSLFSVTYEDETKYVKNETLFDTNTSLLYEGISYQITNVEIAKEIGNRENVDTFLFDEDIDETGKLNESMRFIWVTLKMKNTTEEEKEILVNYPLAWIYTDNVVTEAAAEGIYIYPEQENKKPNEKFHCILESGEEKEVEVGYILSEINTEGKLYFCLGQSGSELDSAENHFLYLGELINEK